MKPIEMTILAISCIAAIISVVIAYRASKKQEQLQEQANEMAKRANEIQEENNRIQASEKLLGWHDVEKYVNVIIQKMEDDGFVPDFIYAPIRGSAIVASMICHNMKRRVPIFVGMGIAKWQEKKEPTREGYITKKLSEQGDYVFVQENLPVKSTDRMLIVRDHSGSGVCFSTIQEHFSEFYGLQKENVKKACISYVESRFNPPDYFCRTANDIWFPWGKNQ